MKVSFMEVDEVVIGQLHPTVRCLVNLTWKDRKGCRDGDVSDADRNELVLPIETTRRNPRVGQPVERDVVER